MSASSYFQTLRVERQDLPDGGCILRSVEPLGDYPTSITTYLRHWADAAPDRPFLAERNPAGSGWSQVSFGEMLSRAESVAQFLIENGASAERPVAILSENSIAHATVSLACLHVGISVAPISPAYSTNPQAFSKLAHCYELLKPAVLFVEDATSYGQALDRLGPGATRLARTGSSGATVSLDEALKATPHSAVREAAAQVGLDHVAKILFTSGSTGMPKGVMTTQRMLCANQQQLMQLYPVLARRPPLLLEWLPWSHVFGGNETFNLVLRNGGTLYIDDGRPTSEALFERTIQNLWSAAPNLFFNVPRAFAMLADRLEADPELRRRFFAELDLMFYAGAALQQSVWDRLDRMGREVRGEAVAMVTAWGTTETAPLSTGVRVPSKRADNIGVPVAGCDLKLAPLGNKLELRVRGPHVTPGYWKDPERTRAAFDEDGFYRTGDAGSLADEHDASEGVIFDGRLAEDFKLSTGTWVSVGRLRLATIEALQPIARDVVIAGHDRDFIGLLVFLAEDGCREIASRNWSDACADLSRHPAIARYVGERLALFNSAQIGSSASIRRAIILADPPSIEGHEITDKGYINQKEVLKRRAAFVERLYSGGDDIICA